MIKLIPQPREIEINESKRLALDHIALGGKRLINDTVKDDFLSFCNMPSGEANIIFENNSSLDNEEYTLQITDKIVIASSTASGQIYALQTLKQIIFQCGQDLPQLVIKDRPAHKIRGFMLDVGRYFFPISDVKTMIRRMALHKLNLLHLHLTEDQGWRIEIDKYPLLTQIGSKRSHTNFDCKPRGGFYTKTDIKEIVDYAHAFGIKVMPEFDIPGHMTAAIACYNNLTCFPRPMPVATHWGVKHDVLCVGKESTMKFVHDILDEFFEMFPDEYIHIGGDEVPKHRWNLCPACQAKMNELGVKDGDELQMWFMNEVKNYCKAHGKQTFMWSWDLDGDTMLDTDLGFSKCHTMDTGDRPFIDTSASAYYIDLPYGYISLEKTAEHKPYAGSCLGVEAALWTEYVPNMKKADYMSYPRIGCLAETGWNGSCTWAGFEKKLDYYYAFLDKNNIGYAKIKNANPSALRGKMQVLWFERRQLAWEGLTNIIKDKKAEHIARRM